MCASVLVLFRFYTYTLMYITGVCFCFLIPTLYTYISHSNVLKSFTSCFLNTTDAIYIYIYIYIYISERERKSKRERREKESDRLRGERARQRDRKA